MAGSLHGVARSASATAAVTQPLDPFERHRDEVPSALASGDAKAVKNLYRRLGSYLEDASPEISEVPVLSYPETASLVASRVPDAPLVLDAGCGPNPVLALLLARRPGSIVVALDIGEGMVRLACRVADAQGVSLLGVVGDVENLPFRAASFGAVVCDDTIEHLPDDIGGVSELARVLADDGTAVAVTPNRHRLDVLLARLRDVVKRRRLPDAAYYAAESHLREYSVQQFRSLLRGSFADVQMVPNGWPPEGAWRAVNAVVRAPLVRRGSRLAFAIARRGGTSQAP